MFDIRKMQEKTIFAAVEKVSDAETATEIVFDKNRSAQSEDDPTWVAATMRRLQKRFDADTVKLIRMDCQCGYGMDEKQALLEHLKRHASSLEEFASSDEAKAAGLFYYDGQLFLRFDFSTCPMLAQVEKLSDMAWCQCSAGYSKTLFEKTFDCPVAVTMLKSIKCGDDFCLMSINMPDSVWK